MTKQTNSILYFDDPKHLKGFRLVRLGDILRRDPVKVKLNPDRKYKRPTVKLYGEGVAIRDQVPGKAIKSRDKFRIKTGQLILSKIDAKDGAVGIVPPKLNHAIVTWDFPHFEIDTRKVRPDFLVWVLTRKRAGEYLAAISNGTSKRKRITLEAFLNTRIPLPPIRQQRSVMRMPVPPIQ